MSDQTRLGEQNGVRSKEPVRQLTLAGIGISLYDRDSADELRSEAESKASGTVGCNADHGAAVMAASGNTYSGVRICPPNERLSTHAVRLAVEKALEAGERRVIGVAVYHGDGKTEVCGGCRELLAEYRHGETPVTIVNDNDRTETTVRGLFPDP